MASKSMEDLMKEADEIVQKIKDQPPAQKDKMWRRLENLLRHHINQLIYIFFGERGDNLHYTIFKIMLSNFQSASSIKDTGELVYTAREIVRHSNLSKDDILQQIYLTIWDIVRIYEPRGMNFIQVLSWLLPRKMATWLWKQSKDAVSQFYMSKPKDELEDDDKENPTSDFITRAAHGDMDFTNIPEVVGLREDEVLKLMMGQDEDYIRLKKLIWKASLQVYKQLFKTKHKDLTVLGIW